MCAVCNGWTYEKVWAHMTSQILERGFSIQYVEVGDDRNPSFAYTVGLSGLNHPEFIVFSTCPECAVGALEPVASAVLAGRRFDEGDDPSDLYPFDEPATLLRFPDSSTHLEAANAMYRGRGRPPIPALQLFWPSQLTLLQSQPIEPTAPPSTTRSGEDEAMEPVVPRPNDGGRRTAVRRRKPVRRRRRRPRGR